MLKKYVVLTLISRIIKKLFVSPEVSGAFSAIMSLRHSIMSLVGFICIAVMAQDGRDFQNLYSYRSFIYLRDSLMVKNWTSIVDELLLSAKRVPRSSQQAFYFVVRAVLSTRGIEER